MCKIIYVGAWAYGYRSRDLASRFDMDRLGSQLHVNGEPCVEGTLEDRPLGQVRYAGEEE